MKFLIDAQLPRRLVSLLDDLGHDAIHTLDMSNGNRTNDQEVIAAAHTDLGGESCPVRPTPPP